MKSPVVISDPTWTEQGPIEVSAVSGWVREDAFYIELDLDVKYAESDIVSHDEAGLTLTLAPTDRSVVPDGLDRDGMTVLTIVCPDSYQWKAVAKTTKYTTRIVGVRKA